MCAVWRHRQTAHGLCSDHFTRSLLICTAVFDHAPARSRITPPGSRVDAAHSDRKPTGAGTDGMVSSVVTGTESAAGVVGPRSPIGSRQQAPQQQQLQHGTQMNRAANLAPALRLDPSQIAHMVGEYPALRNISHGQLADKLMEMANMLQLHPQQLSEALAAKPKVLGCSLGEFESRVRELQKLLGGVETVSQLVLQEPKLLSWSPRHLTQRLANMSACLGIKQDQLLVMIKEQPQLLPASSHWVRALQLVQQLLHMAETAQRSGFGISRASTANAVHQHQHAEQELLLQQVAVVGQQIQQLGSVVQQQHPQPVTDAAAMLAMRQQHLATLQRLQQQMQQMQIQLQQLQQKQQCMNSLPAAQQYLLQHPQLLLLPPEVILAHLATMQAQSGLSVAEVAAVVMAHPHLLFSDHSSGEHSKLDGSETKQQYKQQRQQGQHQRRQGNKHRIYQQQRQQKHQIPATG